MAESTTQPEAAEEALERNDRKTRRGYVTSDKMDKTITVSVEERVKHPFTARCSAARARSRRTTPTTRPASATSS